eukprot:399997-Rhodomonas_salina.1
MRMWRSPEKPKQGWRVRSWMGSVERRSWSAVLMSVSRFSGSVLPRVRFAFHPRMPCCVSVRHWPSGVFLQQCAIGHPGSSSSSQQ